MEPHAFWAACTLFVYSPLRSTKGLEYVYLLLAVMLDYLRSQLWKKQPRCFLVPNMEKGIRYIRDSWLLSS